MFYGPQEALDKQLALEWVVDGTGKHMTTPPSHNRHSTITQLTFTTLLLRADLAAPRSFYDITMMLDGCVRGEETMLLAPRAPRPQRDLT
jgi:hypothetical protein